MNQNLLIALLVITLIVNVALGIELYTVLHPPSNAVNIQHSTSPEVSNTTTSTLTNSSTLYSFSYVVKVQIHIHKEGEYLIEIHPKGFKELFLIMYFKDGSTVQLSLNNTQTLVKIDERGDIQVTLYIYGQTSTPLSEDQVLQNINLNITSISTSESESD